MQRYYIKIISPIIRSMHAIFLLTGFCDRAQKLFFSSLFTCLVVLSESCFTMKKAIPNVMPDQVKKLPKDCHSVIASFLSNNIFENAAGEGELALVKLLLKSREYCNETISDALWFAVEEEKYATFKYIAQYCKDKGIVLTEDATRAVVETACNKDSKIAADFVASSEQFNDYEKEEVLFYLLKRQRIKYIKSFFKDYISKMSNKRASCCLEKIAEMIHAWSTKKNSCYELIDFILSLYDVKTHEKIKGSCIARATVFKNKKLLKKLLASKKIMFDKKVLSDALILSYRDDNKEIIKLLLTFKDDHSIDIDLDTVKKSAALEKKYKDYAATHRTGLFVVDWSIVGEKNITKAMSGGFRGFECKCSKPCSH